MELSRTKSATLLSGQSRIDSGRLHAALTRVTDELLAARNADGHWAGELSSSALSTATAVTALGIAEKNSALRIPPSALARGLAWLAQHVNVDGGWGDTTQSLSNLSTTALGWAAFNAVPGADEKHRGIVTGAERWLAGRCGFPHGALDDSHSILADAIIRRYGKDRTFSVPILTTLALTGRLGKGQDAWRQVLPLPFELAACPHQWFAALQLPVVSYALPALIAIGQARHFHLPSRNPVARLVRTLARERTLKVLTGIQPGSGGFLEATPLTSFVVMSLADSGQAEHPVTKRGVEFLLRSQRADGSWPIDTNLATWVTTLAANAIAGGSGAAARPEAGDWPLPIRDWLLAQQYRIEHPYTHAAPGGWAWTDLPGGVPDADDTSGALLALSNIRSAERARRGEGKDGRIRDAATAGVRWLLDLQNRDGGMPTFCRGWGALPFDRSGADLTAHAIRAWLAWRSELPELRQRTDRAVLRAISFLAKTQRADGSWVPLWFGNQFAPEEENPTYGTARVARALADLSANSIHTADELLVKAARWLLGAQQADGSWGGAMVGPASVEETALVAEALAGMVPLLSRIDKKRELEALPVSLVRGANWLMQRVESGTWTQPSPIGFYFARLWYYERLYPQIFTVGALGQVVRILEALEGVR